MQCLYFRKNVEAAAARIPRKGKRREIIRVARRDTSRNHDLAVALNRDSASYRRPLLVLETEIGDRDSVVSEARIQLTRLRADLYPSA